MDCIENLDGADENASLLSTKSLHASPDTITSERFFRGVGVVTHVSHSELIRRLRALTLKLLPVEVGTKELAAATSRIISPHVVKIYQQAAGDFQEAVGTHFRPLLQ